MPVTLCVALFLVLVAGCSNGEPPCPASQAPQSVATDTPAVSFPPRERVFGEFLLRGNVRVVEGDPDTLRVVLTATNTADETRKFTFATCSQVYAYRADSSPTQPAWNSARRRSWPEGAPIVCGTQVMFYFLAPGKPFPIGPDYSVPQILGDSLPPGRYHFVQEIMLYGPDPGSRGQPVRLGLGAVHLE